MFWGTAYPPAAMKNISMITPVIQNEMVQSGLKSTQICRNGKVRKIQMKWYGQQQQRSEV